MTKNQISLKDALINKFETPSSKYDGKFTKTTQFMLHSVGIDIRSPSVFKFFINAFLDDVEHRHRYTRPIFVLMGCKDFKDKEWNKVYTKLALSENYCMDYDCGNQKGYGLVMMVFSVPENFAADYYHFKQGRYSMFSNEYKSLFPQYLQDDNNKEVESVVWKIIHKSESLKRHIEKEFGMNFGEIDKPTIINKIEYPPAVEVWDKPRKEREYYRYERKNEVSIP